MELLPLQTIDNSNRKYTNHTVLFAINSVNLYTIENVAEVHTREQLGAFFTIIQLSSNS
jgi:hypothetical protein